MTKTSNKPAPATLVERLNGIVRVPVNDGAGPLNGLDYFERQFPASKLALEAAARIQHLESEVDRLSKARTLAEALEQRAATAERSLSALLAASDGVAALLAAGREKLCKQVGERDTEFVKRIARAFNRALFVQTSQEADKPLPVSFRYTNWRGEDGVRRVIPIRLYFGSTQWHPDQQWLLEAFDVDKGEVRAFAVRDMRPPPPSGKEPAQ